MVDVISRYSGLISVTTPVLVATIAAGVGGSNQGAILKQADAVCNGSGAVGTCQIQWLVSGASNPVCQKFTIPVGGALYSDGTMGLAPGDTLYVQCSPANAFNVTVSWDQLS